ncbi:MAG: hypothetical protein ACM3NR_01230 [Methanosarcina sp.]
MKNLTSAFMCMLFILLTGCAPVKFYSDPSLTKSTGFRYYSAKPYLQVERDSQSGSIIKATVVYLPDLANPQYLYMPGGLGSRKLDVAVNNGTIEKFGLTSDNNIPEMIEAMAASVSKSADAVKDLSGLKGVPQSGPSIVTELYEIKMDSEGTSLKKIEIK